MSISDYDNISPTDKHIWRKCTNLLRVDTFASEDRYQAERRVRVISYYKYTFLYCLKNCKQENLLREKFENRKYFLQINKLLEILVFWKYIQGIPIYGGKKLSTIFDNAFVCVSVSQFGFMWLKLDS